MLPAPKTKLPRPTESFETEGFDPDSLVPPTIEPGEPMPPPLPVMTNGFTSSAEGRGNLDPSNDLELNLSRIEVPSQLAGKASGGQAKITMAAEKVTDTRVVELGFHPSLSRSANFDDRADDDGLYLVLQPKNERGQMVPEAADLSIVVLDPAREGDAARIGRWDYSAEEVRGKMQPIGSNQGIHLTLPWNGPDPSADRVIVFARYTFENGRQVIGQKEIFVSSDGGLRTVWAPRGTTANPAAHDEPVSRVAQASAESTSAAAVNVVRPAVGTTTGEPAPPPYSSRQ